MTSLRILLVEDDPSAALDVEMLIDELGYELIAKIDNGQQALHEIQAVQPDLVIMDIELKGKLSGLDIAKEIKHLEIPVIFTTSYRDKEVFESTKSTYSFGYLVKPFDRLTLQSAIEQVVRALYNEEVLLSGDEVWKEDLLVRDCFLIKNQNLLHKVFLDDISYIQGEGNYCTLFAKGKKYVVKISLKKILNDLDLQRFAPVHKSYIVHLDKVDAIDVSTNKIIIDKDQLPLGRAFKQRLLERFKLLK